MEWLSHDDRTLKEHLAGLKDVIDFVLKEKSQCLFSDEELKKRLYCLISYHDLAKASIYFQLYLTNSLISKETGHKYYSIAELKKFLNTNEEKFDEWKHLPELKEHSLFGAWTALTQFNSESRYSLDAFLFSKILKRHHGYLRNFNLANTNPVDKRHNLEKIGQNIDLGKYSNMVNEIGLPFYHANILEILDNFTIRNFARLERFLNSNKDGAYYYKTLFQYSLLLSADKGDVMLSNKIFLRNKIDSSIVDSFKANNLKTSYSINLLREEAYSIALKRADEYGGKNFFAITLPTGLGKTFTAYKIALQIREQFCANFRIVYCLPFTSIIDQNASIFKRILENANIPVEQIGVHHHLSAPEIKNDEDDSYYTEWEYFTEGWQNEIIITTFLQLWESLFANHNRQIRKFHNLVNSIIILDEIQSINPALLPALEFTMENLAKFFNTKFILVTATQPILLRDKVVELCLKESNDYFFKKMNRTILNTSYLKSGDISEEELGNIIIKKFKKDLQSILVICNTIRFSQQLYKFVSEEVDDDILFYLSAAIVPYSRELLIEQEIKSKLAEKTPIILISTQVVEAGVDIDFDIVYRDFAPLSSINQAAGRCNRNSTKGVSEVFLFRSGKEKIYDPTQLDVTINTLRKFDFKIPENQFFKLNQIFFEEIKMKIQDDSNVSNSLINSILTLKFEDIGTNEKYRLIVEKYESSNFFIPINEDAEELWNKYLLLFDIEEHFKRKIAIKMLTPKLMKFVVKIPNYSYSPKQEDKGKTLIYDEDWPTFYDEKFGYKIPEEEKVVEVF